MNSNTSAVKSATGAASKATDDLANRAHDTIDSTVAGAKSVIGSAQSMAKDAVDTADRTTRRVVDSSTQTIGDFIDTASSLSKDASAAIRQNPLLIVGGALLAGFLIAKMRR